MSEGLGFVVSKILDQLISREAQSMEVTCFDIGLRRASLRFTIKYVPISFVRQKNCITKRDFLKWSKSF